MSMSVDDRDSTFSIALGTLTVGELRCNQTCSLKSVLNDFALIVSRVICAETKPDDRELLAAHFDQRLLNEIDKQERKKGNRQ